MSIRTLLTIGFDLLILWYVVFVAGTIQFRILKKKTIELVLKYTQEAIDGNQLCRPEQIYGALYPEWCQMVRKTAWFIPSKSELRPILATPENVRKRLGFSPKWVSECWRDKRPELIAVDGFVKGQNA